jgi:AAA15 family ATPase/GTPase
MIQAFEVEHFENIWCIQLDELKSINLFSGKNNVWKTTISSSGCIFSQDH